MKETPERKPENKVEGPKMSTEALLEAIESSVRGFDSVRVDRWTEEDTVVFKAVVSKRGERMEKEVKVNPLNGELLSETLYHINPDGDRKMLVFNDLKFGPKKYPDPALSLEGADWETLAEDARARRRAVDEGEKWLGDIN